MKQAAHSISTQRLDRHLRWSQLTLLRLAAWIVHIAGIWQPLERAVEAMLAPRIADLRNIILMLITIKAARRRAPLNPSRRYGPQRKAHIQRYRLVFGSRLRKLTRARDVRAKITALLSLIQNAEREITRFARHLRRGLNRRRGGIAKSAFDTLLAPYLLLALDRFRRPDTS